MQTLHTTNLRQPRSPLLYVHDNANYAWYQADKVVNSMQDFRSLHLISIITQFPQRCAQEIIEEARAFLCFSLPSGFWILPNLQAVKVSVENRGHWEILGLCKAESQSLDFAREDYRP